MLSPSSVGYNDTDQPIQVHLLQRPNIIRSQSHFKSINNINFIDRK